MLNSETNLQLISHLSSCFIISGPSLAAVYISQKKNNSVITNMIILWNIFPQSWHLATPSGYYTPRGPDPDSLTVQYISIYCPDNWPTPEINSLLLYPVIKWPDLFIDTVIDTVCRIYIVSGEELLLSMQWGKFPTKVWGMSKLQLFPPPLSKQGNHGKFAAVMCHLQGQYDPTCDKVHYCCFQALLGIS